MLCLDGGKGEGGVEGSELGRFNEHCLGVSLSRRKNDLRGL
jgi:hypothetical protein